MKNENVLIPFSCGVFNASRTFAFLGVWLLFQSASSHPCPCFRFYMRERGGQTDRQTETERQRQTETDTETDRSFFFFLRAKQPTFLHRETASEDQNVE